MLIMFLRVILFSYWFLGVTGPPNLPGSWSSRFYADMTSAVFLISSSLAIAYMIVPHCVHGSCPT